jgi:hypothetical protein
LVQIWHICLTDCEGNFFTEDEEMSQIALQESTVRSILLSLLLDPGKQFITWSTVLEMRKMALSLILSLMKVTPKELADSAKFCNQYLDLLAKYVQMLAVILRCYCRIQIQEMTTNNFQLLATLLDGIRQAVALNPK